MAIRVSIIICGALASLLMYWITAWGPGISLDSIVYIQTAKSLLSGNGLYADNQPLTHFPPTYPLLIAIASFFYKADLIQATRLLGALFTGVNIVLLALAIQMCTKNNLAAVCTIIVFFLSSATIFSVHSMAWSEPLFITFTLAALIILSLYIINSKLYFLVMASVFVSFALTTRYTGITLLPTIALSLLIFGDRSLKHKILNIFLAIIIASLPLAIYLIRNILVAQSATNRALSIHPIGIEKIKQGVYTTISFVLPISIYISIKIILIIIFIVFLMLSIFF